MAAMSASSNVMGALIAASIVAKEGEIVSPPSLIPNDQRLANKYLFAVGRVLLFAFPLHIPTCNERFQ